MSDDEARARRQVRVGRSADVPAQEATRCKGALGPARRTDPEPPRAADGLGRPATVTAGTMSTQAKSLLIVAVAGEAKALTPSLEREIRERESASAPPTSRVSQHLSGHPQWLPVIAITGQVPL